MKDYSYNSGFVKGFDEKVKNMVQKGVALSDEETFNKLALQEFEIQYNNIEFFKNYCLAQGIRPETVKTWADIPAVPSAIFKERVIATFPLTETELSLMTSGTSNPHSPSKIYRDKRTVEIYYLANAIMAKNYLFPDVERMKILLMVPSPKIAPAMGLAVGLEQLKQNFGTEDSTYLITPDGMEWELLFQALHDAEISGEPVALVGATSGLVYFYRFCLEQGLKFNLPPGSRICDGGGYLGTFGDCSREEYLQLCRETLAVPPQYCVNTLGSGESATNYFDNVLRNHYLGLEGIPRYKACPPWTRTIVVNRETGQRLPPGEVGLICHYDLVNRSNLLAVKTNNLGYEAGDGFEILGRADAGGKSDHTAINNMLKGKNTVCAATTDRMLYGDNQVLANMANPGPMEDGTVCSTVADNLLTAENRVCSTVADEMLQDSGRVCSTVADEMLTDSQRVCSTVADKMLSETQQLLAKSPHGNMFDGMPKERLEKLRKLCPYLKLKGMLKKKH